MSIQAVAWALEQELPARPKLVLVSIANHADHTNGYCWLKAETIAKEAACTPRSIYNFVGALVRNGFIRKTPRKGEDGKQRATDYWILFDRDEKPWDQGASLEPDEGEGEPSESDSAEDQPQDVVSPHERRSGGENAEPDEPTFHRQPEKLPPGSCGPAESGFHRERIAEPSKSNSRESSAREAVTKAAVRSYRPPPPQPVGEVFNNGKDVFVFDGTPAYEAWAKVKARTNGIGSWHCTTRKLVDGKWRSGWYFPSLFPPERKRSTDPPEISDQDARELEKH